MPNIEIERRPMIRNYSPYARGRRFEYRTRDYLRKLGWFVVRQPRSAFPDLVAIRDGSIILVECKVDGYMPSTERRYMVRLARRKVGGKAVLAFRRGRVLLLRQLSPRSANFDRPFEPSAEDQR